MSQKAKRPRLLIGRLVASSNPVKVSVIKALDIAHIYRDNSYNRVGRLVIH